MKASSMIRLLGVSFLILEACVAQSNQTAGHARLYCGTDTTGFSGENGQIAVVPVNGPAVTGLPAIFNLDFLLNGITNLPPGLLVGQPETNAASDTLRELKLPATNTPPVLPGRFRLAPIPFS